jgi:asparagine synthase (glutamine-hydrolysing)
MSALAVLFHRDGQAVEAASVWAMLDAVPYRGPDGAAVTERGYVGLGHAKMALTLAERAERQPLVSNRTGCVLVADARLDNRNDLLRQLPDQPPGSATDAELILRVYEAWGPDGVDRLLGDFAFAIWDPRHRRLLCARDTSGLRSLFYRVDAQKFAVASEIHQLFQDPAVPVLPDEEHVRESLVPFFVFQNEKQQARTWFQGIWALPAGHILLVDASSVRTYSYWRLEPRELRYRSDDEYAEHYLDLFSEVVRARLRTSEPVGVLLSGGLDSSSIASVAQELYRRRDLDNAGFATFSSVFDDPECDERPLIEDVQAKYGFDAQFIADGGFAGRLQVEPWGFQESPNMGVTEARDAVFGAISRASVRVLLSGTGADGCVGGSRRVLDSVLRQGHLQEFARHWRTYRRLARSEESVAATLGLYCVAPLLPMAVQRRLMTASLRRRYAQSRDRLLPPWMPGALRGELSQRHLRLCLEAEAGRRFSNPVREDEFRLLYPPEVARHPVPWPVEERRPFADRRLHEFLLAIPPEQKFNPHPDTDNLYAGQNQVLRRAMRGILPESIRSRTQKTIFRGVWENEIQRQWPLYEAAFGPSSRPEIAARGYVDQTSFWLRLGELRNGLFGDDFIYVMKLVELETWLRTLRLPRSRLVTVPPPWHERQLRPEIPVPPEPVRTAVH